MSPGKLLGGRRLLLGKLVPYGVGKDVKSEVNVANKTTSKRPSLASPISSPLSSGSRERTVRGPGSGGWLRGGRSAAAQFL